MSAAASERKPIASEGSSGALTEVMRLMRDMGSKKGFDPMPPDQYLTLIDKRYPPKIRLLAWLCSKTIRRGHWRPYAVDEEGKELTLQRAAADLDMDQGNLDRAWRQLEQEGRVRKEARRLYLSGEVRFSGAKEKRSEQVCTDLFEPYLLRQINKLPHERRAQFLWRFEQERELKKKLLADAVAAVRSIADQREDTLLSEFGIKKIRLEKFRPPSPLVEPLLPVVDRYVQTPSVQTSSDCVQSSEAAVYTAGNGSAQTSASLLSLESTEGAEFSVSEDSFKRELVELVELSSQSQPTNQPTSSDQELKNKRAELEQYLKGFTREIGIAPDAQITTRIFQELGSASVEQLRTIITAQQLKGFRVTSWGAFLFHAAEANRSHEEFAKAPPAAPVGRQATKLIRETREAYAKRMGLI